MVQLPNHFYLSLRVSIRDVRAIKSKLGIWFRPDGCSSKSSEELNFVDLGYSISVPPPTYCLRPHSHAVQLSLPLEMVFPGFKSALSCVFAQCDALFKPLLEDMDHSDDSSYVT